MIQFEGVSKQFADGTVAIDSLDIEIKDGEFFVFIGPSGSGKTTTLKMINQLISPSKGTILIDGKKNSDYDVYQLRWNIGYVLQQIALFPHMTIEENITVVPELKKWPKDKMKQRAEELLRMVGLKPEDYATRKPDQLSGGEQQRVGVIRALATDPNIILMDEPFSALDPISRETLQEDLLNIMSNLKKTTVFVTHDIQEALKLADRICIMQEGKVVQIGTPTEIIQHPKNQFVQQFIGASHTTWGDTINVENIALPVDKLDKTPKQKITTPILLDNLLHKLANEEVLLVEKHDDVIGYVDRQSVIQYLSERGRSNE